SIDRALQPATKSTVAPIYLSLIKDSDKLLGGFIPTLIDDSLITPDANTLIITIKKRAPYFLAMLTYPCSFVVEKHLIDSYKTAIANNAWKGTVLPTNHIVPEGMPGYNPDLSGPDGTQSLKGNPEQAKTLLQMGLKEEKIATLPPIKLTYATSTSVAYFDQEVTTMIKMWHDVLGVTVTADPIDYNSLLTQVTLASGNAYGFEFWVYTWVAEYPDPQDWLTRQFDSGVPNNNMNYGQNTSSDV